MAPEGARGSGGADTTGRIRGPAGRVRHRSRRNGTSDVRRAGALHGRAAGRRRGAGAPGARPRAASAALPGHVPEATGTTPAELREAGVPPGVLGLAAVLAPRGGGTGNRRLARIAAHPGAEAVERAVADVRMRRGDGASRAQGPADSGPAADSDSDSGHGRGHGRGSARRRRGRGSAPGPGPCDGSGP